MGKNVGLRLGHKLDTPHGDGNQLLGESYSMQGPSKSAEASPVYSGNLLPLWTLAFLERVLNDLNEEMPVLQAQARHYVHWISTFPNRQITQHCYCSFCILSL